MSSQLEVPDIGSEPGCSTSWPAGQQASAQGNTPMEGGAVAADPLQQASVAPSEPDECLPSPTHAEAVAQGVHIAKFHLASPAASFLERSTGA